MDAHNAIIANVMDVVGIEAAASNPDGSDRCPLCFINWAHKKYCVNSACTMKSGYNHWIDRAADDQLEIWKSLKI